MSSSLAHDAVIKGELPYVDPRYRDKNRSLIEGRMVEIMEKCYRFNQTERATIFEVVSHLRETARLANLYAKNTTLI